MIGSTIVSKVYKLLNHGFQKYSQIYFYLLPPQSHEVSVWRIKFRPITVPVSTTNYYGIRKVVKFGN